jgi:hypothetical protein
VYDFNFNDFGEHKTEVKQAIPTAVKDEEDFLYISSVNDHGMMVGDVYFPIVGDPGYFAGYPVAIKFDETSHKFSSSIETQDIGNDQWGLFPLFYQFFNYVANPDANGKSSVYLAASFPLDNEAPYTHFVTFLTEYVYDSNSQQGKISNQQTVSTFDTTKAIAEELHASPDGSYIFTAPAYYIDKSTPTVAMSRVFKNANNTTVLAVSQSGVIVLSTQSQKIQTLDSLTWVVDSLSSEAFTEHIRADRYEITLDRLKSEDSLTATIFEMYLNQSE